MPKIKKEFLNKRRQDILRIVVQEYILTGQPVASGYLVSKYSLNVSPATVRNDLAYLEECGYLMQPHLSAGRIPTDRGYEFYVREMLDKNFITDEEKNAILKVLKKNNQEIDALHTEAARIIARLTKCFGVAIANAPKELGTALFELVRLSRSRLLVLLVLDDGNVYRKEIEVFEDLSDDTVEYAKSRIKSEISGKPVSKINELNALTGPEDHKDLPSAYLYNRIVSELKKIVSELAAESKVYLSTEDVDWFEEFLSPESVSRIYSLVGYKKIVSGLVHEALEKNSIVVKIGQENPITSELSILIAPYNAKKLSGAIGVIGPKRMNYIRAISTARFVSRQLAEVISRCF